MNLGRQGAREVRGGVARQRAIGGTNGEEDRQPVPGSENDIKTH